jgi:creatinine amidohydrolase
MDWLTTATSPDERDRATDVAVLPMGSFEQHGSHLPLTTELLTSSWLPVP